MRSYKRDARGSDLHSKVHGRGKIALALLALMLVGVMAAGALAETGPFSALSGLTGMTETTNTATAGDSSSATATDSTSDPAPISGRYIVTFVGGTTDSDARTTLAAHDANVDSRIAALRMYSVALSAERVDALAADPSVSRVEADRPRDASEAPNDPDYAGQWALPRIGWEEARNSVTPTGSATVAILDTGVDASHPDLDGSLVGGTSILDGAEPTVDPNGHGTQIAGVVAAETDNNEGIAGVGYAGVNVMPVTVLGADGTGQDSDIIEGVVWAADHGADVILMSFSNPGFSESLQAAIDYAWSQNVVLVAATGNGGSTEPTFPAGDRGVVGVASTDALDALAPSSNYGEAAFMAAPGVDILSTSAGGGYSALTGTSAAAAEVAGAAALLRAASGASNGVVVGRLARNADPAGTTSETGNGRLNLARALEDTSTESVQPAGAAPVGSGGPLVGPYVAAASRFWAGCMDTSWSTAGNWSTSPTATCTGPGGAATSPTTPAGNGDTATITGSRTFYPNIASGTITIQTFTVNAGASLTVSGGALNATNADDSTNNGTLNVSSSGAVTVRRDLLGSGTFNLTGGTLQITRSLALTSYTGWNATGGTVGFTTGAGSNNNQLLNVPAAGIQFHNLTVSGTQSSNLATNSKTIKIAGTLTWSNTNTSAANRVGGGAVFNGSTAQLTAGTQTALFNSLTMQNASGLTFGNNATVNNTLTLTSGNITTGANTLTLNGSASGASTNSHVVGNLKRPFGTGAVSAMFDIGTATAYTPLFVAVSGSGGTAGSLTATTLGMDHPNIATSGLNAMKHIARYWTLTPDATFALGATRSYRAHFQFLVGDVPAGASAFDFFVRRFTPAAPSAGTWFETSPGAKSAATIETSGLRDFGDFAIGERAAPTTTSISPTSKDPGAAAFTLTVNGTNFYSDSVVRFAGSNRTTTYVNSTQLTAAIPASDVTTSGQYAITVFTPAPGGGTTNAQTFTVTRSTSTSVSCVPSSVVVGSASTCTATVTDTASGSPSNPTGTVSWTTTGGSLSSASCVLENVPSSSSQSRCSVNLYAPTATGSATVTATYGGSAAHAGSNGNTSVSFVACTTNKICIDGLMGDWAALTTTPSFPDNPSDAGGGSTDITAVRVTSGDGNLYVRWDQMLTNNKNKIAQDAFSVTVDANRDGTPDARVWVMFDSAGIATVEVERPIGTFTNVGIAQQTCNVVVCANGATSSIEASVPLSALNATGAVIGLQAETRASPSTTSAVKDCVPGTGSGVCNGYFNLDTDTGVVTVTAGHRTTTTLDCPQSIVTVGFATSTCTVTVVDTGLDTNNQSVTKANPTGTVNFSSSGSGTFAPASCTLQPAVGFTDRSTCTLTYTPTTIGTGTHTLTASYAGDTSPIQFASSSGTDTLTVAPVNAAPMCSNDSGSTNEDTALEDSVSCADADGNTLTYSAVSNPTNGTLDFDSDGSFTYTPNADFFGSDSFTFRANDGTVNSTTVTYSISVNSVNDAPIAVDDAYSLGEDSTLVVPDPVGLLANDTDVEGNALTAQLVSQPANGAVTLTNPPNGGFVYVPNNNFCGTDTFTYRANDGQASNNLSNVATVTLTVTCVNDPPVAVADTPSTDEDTAKVINVLANDSPGPANESSQTIAVDSITVQPTHGTATLITTGADEGKVRYTPNADFNGSDTFTYKVCDNGTPSACATATVTVTVNRVNDAPTATAQSLSTNEDTAKTITLAGSDVDGDSLSFKVTTLPGHGKLYSGSSVVAANEITAADLPKSLSGNQVTYDPAANYNGSDSFNFKANDGSLDSAAAQVSITVDPLNDKPSASDDSRSMDEDGAALSIDLRDLVSDVETSDANLTYTIVAGPSAAQGTLTASASNGLYSFDSADNFNGTVTVDYKVTDRGDPDNCGAVVAGSCTAALSSETKTVTITVRPLNDAPVLAAIGDKSVDEEAELTFTATATDVDSTNLTFSLVGAPAGAAISSSTGAFSWTPTEAQGPGSYTFKVKVTDDGTPAASDDEQITVTVREVNRAPALATIADKQVNEETQLSFTAQGSDPDLPANTLTYSFVGASHGATINPSTGAFSWTPTEAQGPDTYTFTIKVSDGSLSAEQTFQVQVNEVNRAPSLGSFATPSNGVWGNELTFTATATDPDVPANTLTFSLVNGPTGATINASSGAFSWTPTATQIGSHTFSVRVTDNGTPNMSDTRSLTIVVGKRATKLVYDGATSGVYSDPATVSATLKDDSPGAANGNPIGTKTIGFTLGTQSTSAPTSSAGVASGSITLNQPAGTPTVKASFAIDAHYLASEDSKPFTIAKETMHLEYTGQTFLTTSKVGGTVAPQLSAKVTEQQDGSLGTKTWSSIPLQVKFTVQNASGATLGTCTANVIQGAGGTGTAACSAPAMKADNYVVQIDLVTNGYYAADTENAAITVSDPGTGFTTGGGWINDPNTNAKSNFGFTVKFLKNGSLQGNSLFIYRTKSDLGGKVAGAVPGLRDYNFIVKSNAMDSLVQKCAIGTNGAPVTPCKATFTGKSNVRAVDRQTGISYTLGADVIGNQQYFQVDVTDNGEPGASSSTNPDQYAIRVWTSAGTYYQVGTARATIDSPSTMIALQGGNVQVKP